MIAKKDNKVIYKTSQTLENGQPPNPRDSYINLIVNILNNQMRISRNRLIPEFHDTVLTRQKIGATPIDVARLIITLEKCLDIDLRSPHILMQSYETINGLADLVVDAVKVRDSEKK